jgi:hypothetical protein
MLSSSAAVGSGAGEAVGKLRVVEAGAEIAISVAVGWLVDAITGDWNGSIVRLGSGIAWLKSSWLDK